MVAVSTKWKNLIEVSQSFHRGKILPDIKLLHQDNHPIMDIPWQQCNDGTTHLYRQKTKLPGVSKIMYGEGTPETKSQSAQLRETCTILSGFSTIPRDTSKVGGSQGALRAEEDGDFAESLRQLLGRMLFYDNRANDARDIYGVATLYNKLTGPRGKNIFSCEGASANAQTSAYLFNWGDGCTGIFPEGMTAGYTKMDLGLQVKTLPNGNQLTVLQTEHQWHVGLCISNWLDVCRVCNIEVADALNLTNNQAPSSFKNILHKMLLARLRMRRPGHKVWYVNDTLYALLMRIGMEKSAGAVTVETAVTQFGEFDELRVNRIPVRRCDQIVTTEAVVPT